MNAKFQVVLLVFMFLALPSAGFYLWIKLRKAGNTREVRKMSRHSWAWVTLVLAVVWGGAVAGPLLYSRVHPSADIQRLLLALSRHEPIDESVQPPLTEVFDSAGRLKRAIQLGASWQFSGDVNAGESHSTTETRASYLAWFESRSKPTLLTITRIETDHSSIRFRIGEGDLVSTLVSFLVPLALLGVTAYLLRAK
jgi:hypothetical protein